MIVVSDTSPLNYLILVEQADLLQILFGNIIIPQIVFDELRGKSALLPVVEWTQSLPVWIEIKQTHLIANPSLDILDKGEREAILLAQEFSPPICFWSMTDRLVKLLPAWKSQSRGRSVSWTRRHGPV